MRKLYSGKNFSSISVVKGSEPVSASNTTQLNITAYKTFKVVNDRGEYLEYDGSSYNGNMNVYDCKLIDNLDNTCSWDITVNNKSYEFDNISENNVENTVNNIVIDDESGEIVNSKKLSYTFGDINNDGVINSKDRMTLTRYIANGMA